ENRRYFSDQDQYRRPRQKTEQNMVEYWVPPDKSTGKKSTNGSNGQPTQPRKPNQVCPTTTSGGGGAGNGAAGGTSNGKRAMKIPKVKEPRGDNSSKKSSAAIA
uniref:Uncharacterized protein n=2 Tax=Caenorhabditis japonica TaxID=281687 RepID=A0A8R1ECG2_CAEJA